MVNMSSMVTKNEVVQDFYNAALVTAGAVAVSMVSKKLTGQSLAAPASLKETAKLAFAVAVGSFLIEKGHSAGYIPRQLSLGKKEKS